MKTLSHTQISAYLQCPLKYKCKYIDGLKEKPKPYLSFGTSVHKALEFFYKSKLPTPPSIEDVLGYYKKNWRKDGYKDEAEEKQYFGYGVTIINDFCDKHSHNYKPPLGSEHSLFFEVDGIKLNAIIDRIDKIAEGAVEIVDYKTSKNPYSLSALSKEPQLTMYQLAVEQEFGLRVEKLTYYHLPSQTPFTVSRHDDAKVEDLKNRIVDVARSIENKDFPHTENQFCPCDFAHLCPLYMHEYKKEVPAEKKAIDIVKAADEYGILKDKDKELKAKIGAIQGEIKEYMNSEKADRVFGDKYEVTRSKSGKEFLDTTKAKKVLEKNNLLEGVIKFKETETIRYKERKEAPDEG